MKIEIEETKLKELQRKAKSWDRLGEEIATYYLEPNEEGYDESKDENGLLGIGEAAAMAYGWL